MTSYNDINGAPPVSATMLMDPKLMKQHFTNGSSLQSPLSDTMSSVTRHGSEPPKLPFDSLLNYSDLILPLSKDDAYDAYKLKGRNKKTSTSDAVNPPLTSRFDPKTLLDPKRSNAHSKLRDPSPGARSMSPAITEHHQSNDAAKRDHQAYDEGQGMGSLIERMHGVSKREERPQKKPKTDYSDGYDDGEREKAMFTGGGKGGDIGEFMKQKKKEGLQESGPIGTIVDLTEGILISIVHIHFC